MKSKEIFIATLTSDAKWLVDSCLELGGWVFQVVPLEAWQNQCLDFLFESGPDYSQIVQIRFDDKPRHSNEVGLVELDFQGPCPDKSSSLKYGRIYSSMIDLNYPEIPLAWEQVAGLVKRGFTKRTVDQPYKGKLKKLPVYVGPAAEAWLSQQGRGIAPRP